MEQAHVGEKRKKRAENDVMERAMRDAGEEDSEVDEDRLEMTTEGANKDGKGSKEVVRMGMKIWIQIRALRKKI